jgi:hypothetical protein
MTIDFSSVQMNTLAIHRAGYAAQGGNLFLSETTHTLSDEWLSQVLLSFFLKPFNEAEQYQLEEVDNVLFSLLSNHFAQANSFYENSVAIATHLHACSRNGLIKNGEIYISSFKKFPFNEHQYEAIGIFHTAQKEPYIKVASTTNSLNLAIEEGIDIKKPERGFMAINMPEGMLCLVFEAGVKKEENSFWKKQFLQVTPIANSYHHTKEALGMCKLFISNEISEQFETDKADEAGMLQRSMEYFKTHDSFEFQNFGKEVLHHPELIESFTQYKQQYEVAKQVQIEDNFDINPVAVQQQQRFFKSILKLDKNFHVYVHGRRDLIEKGFDQEKGKHFYKLYFDQETS